MGRFSLSHASTIHSRSRERGESARGGQTRDRQQTRTPTRWRVTTAGPSRQRPEAATRGRRFAPAARAYKVEITHDGVTTEVDVDEDEYILDAVENAGIEVNYDCRMGVCMMCPAKLSAGEVDQSEGMISDDVAEKGFVLMCVVKCQSDCAIQTCTEEELLDEQLMT